MAASAPPLSAGTKLPNELRGQIAVGEITGGKDTNPLWVSNISSSDFQAALEASLRNARLGAADRQSGRYVLAAILQEVNQPLLGASMYVTTTVGYNLAERATNKSVWARTITKGYTARMRDAFYGPTRLRLAIEGSAKANIEEFIGELLKSSDQAVNSFLKPAAVVPPSGSRLPRSNTRFPQAGDTWTYQLTEPKRLDGPKQRSYVVKVASVSDGEIRDELFLENVSAGVVVHSNGSYLVAQGASVFSPYLNVFQQPFVNVAEIAILDQVACKSPYGCTAKGILAGPETVGVPAGRFETIKVIVEHSWYPDQISGQFSPQMRGSRTLTIWYSPELKRAVKFLSRPKSGAIPPIDPDFVLELVSYQLN